MSRIFKNRLIVFSIFFALLWSYPYVFYRLTIEINLNILYGLLLIILSILFLPLKHKLFLPKIFLSICVYQIICFVILGIIHQDTFYFFRYSLFVVLSYYIIWVIHNYISIDQFVKYNNISICIQAFLGMVAFVLFFYGLIQPFFSFNGGGERVAYFLGITCTNFMIGNVIRPSGFFDEPGALAFWGIYTLIFNKLFFKNRLLELTLAISLLFTLSMSYYILLSLYLLFFYYKNIKQGLIILCLFILGFYYINEYEGEESVLYKKTIMRFQKSDSGSVETNRDEMLETGMIYFFKSPIFGNGKTNLEDKYIGVTDAPFENLAYDGVFGTIAIYLPILILIFKIRKIQIIYASVILLTSYLQRPFHIQLFHYLYIYMFFLMSYYKFSNNSFTIYKNSIYNIYNEKESS